MGVSYKKTQLLVVLGYLFLLIIFALSARYIFLQIRVMNRPFEEKEVLEERRKLTGKLLGRLYDAEIIEQAVSSGDKQAYHDYQTSIHEAHLLIDTLMSMTTNPSQLAKIDTLVFFLNEKKNNISMLLHFQKTKSPNMVYQEKLKKEIKRQDSILSLRAINETFIFRPIMDTVKLQEQPLPDVMQEMEETQEMEEMEEFITQEKVDTAVQQAPLLIDSLVKSSTRPPRTTDSLVIILKDIHTGAKKEIQTNESQRARTLRKIRQNGHIISQMINQTISSLEREEMLLNQKHESISNAIMGRSVKTLSGIAIITLLLALGLGLWIIKDITRIHRYREATERARLQAEELLQMREKLMLTITHDIKAPLGSIIGFTELLKRISSNDRMSYYVDNMQKSADHLLKLLTSLLNFHRLDLKKQELTIVRFNVGELLETIKASHQVLMDEKELAFTASIAPPLYDLYMGDPNVLRQVIDNLLSNAVKFTDKGSIHMSATMVGALFVFSVKDSGPGMSEEEQADVFKEFTRLRNAEGKEGFGLGLTIAQQMVLLMEGEISILSLPGEGCEFIVKLPLIKAPPISEEERANTPLERSQVRDEIRVVVIDDDKIQLNLISEILRKEKMTVSCFESPTRALEHLKYHAYDLLITDLQMPEIDGLALFKSLRTSSLELLRSIPVIVISARHDLHMSAVVEEGGAAHLSKPFSDKALIEMIYQLVGVENKRLSSRAVYEETGEERRLSIDSLTTFSKDDPEASRLIVASFIHESKKNYEALERAVLEENRLQIAHLAHKMRPVFLMVQADQCVSILRELEEQAPVADHESLKSCFNHLQKHLFDVLEEASKLAQRVT